MAEIANHGIVASRLSDPGGAKELLERGGRAMAAPIGIGSPCELDGTPVIVAEWGAVGINGGRMGIGTSEANALKELDTQMQFASLVDRDTFWNSATYGRKPAKAK